jgi:hypothetical protein
MSELMRKMALGMADGHLAQADALLCHPRDLEPANFGTHARGRRQTQLEQALRHMRTAAGWMIAAI